MLRNLLRLSAAGKPIYGTPDIGIDASQIIAETATGDHGPGLLYAPAQAHPTKQLRVKITSWSGTPGTLFVFENGSLLIEGQADGAYTIGYDWEAWAADGTPTVVSDTSTVRIGPLNASAPATNISGASTISAGLATGEQNATAPATTVNGTSTINAGVATGGNGNVDATAPATTVSGASSINAGTATGQQNATAPATTVSGASTISAGTATGGAAGDGFAPETTVNGASTISASVATNQQFTSAPSGSGPSIIRPYATRPPNIGGRRR